MEQAPLTNAYAHARNANTNPNPATVSTTLAAVEQHQAAAGEFAVAANGIEDVEALRILSLLEKHHQRLAVIIKDEATRPSPSAVREPSDKPLQSPDKSTQNPQAPLFHRQPSIASNLASARGIPTPSQPRRVRQSSPGNQLQSLTNSKRSQKARQSSPEPTKSVANAHIVERQVDGRSPPSRADQHLSPTKTELEGSTTSGHESFNKFYSRFGGLLSKLSAPLAFTGLPLVPDESPISSNDSSHTPSKEVKDRSTTSEPPDVTSMFSRAALRAVKEAHGAFSNVQESFYVVPTGGGTVSYAGMLSRERQSRHLDPSGLEQVDDEEKFVDARELPQPNSPKVSRTNEAPTRGRTSNKTVEELEMENESLKSLTDNLSRRLYMWEKSAQSQTSALQQSIRTLQSPSQTVPDGTSEEQRAEREAHVQQLEEQIKEARREMERYSRENEKLKTVVMRYRERWEKLKEGARTRRDGTEKGAEAAAEERFLS